jgi:RND family efflux transporter MFP subunit
MKSNIVGARRCRLDGKEGLKVNGRLMTVKSLRDDHKMNEENQEENNGVKEDGASFRERNANHKPIYVALALLGVVVIGGLMFWIFRNREGGKPVPEPRSTSFDPNSNEQTGPTGEEQTITLQPEQIERIGLKIETVGEGFSSETMTRTATGVVQPNAYAETPVVSLVGGVVRKVTAELGQNVSRGQTVAVVFSNELASAQSRYLFLQTDMQTSRQNYQRASKLLKINPVSRAELDEAQARLKTKEAEVDEAQRRYKRTVKLVEIGAASREDFEQDRTKLKTAEAELEEAKKRYDRAIKIAQIAPASNTEFEQAAVKLKTAETEFASAKQRLLLLGLPEQRVNALRSASQITSELALTAPVSGTITKRLVNQGETIEANKELLKVTNLSSVWVIGQVYEKDLASLRTGSGANVTSDTFPGEVFRGNVSYIDPNLDQTTRTAQVRVELTNAGERLKIGMYVNIAFATLGGSENTVPMIPKEAVQNINGQQIVFAATENPNAFLLKPVKLGAETDGMFPVLNGLFVGDKIVTDGSFLLRAEWQKTNSPE